MRAAALAGIDVPKLCATDRLEAFGSCRLCLVEIDGRRGTPASCTTPVADGMVVRTQTPKVAKLRESVMELYISDHPLDCLTCPANGDCELQDMAGVVGLRQVRYGYDGANHLDAVADHSNPYFDFDPSKCIACSRCVRACDEIQGTFALTIEGRGFESKVSAGAGESFMDSECVSCGACVQACPTATLQETLRRATGHPDPVGDHHLRLLRRRLLVQGRDARRRVGPHGAAEGRRRERGPLVCEGTVRLRVRHPSGPDAESDGPREDHRSLARGLWDEAIGTVARRMLDIRHGTARRDRRDHLVAVHERRGVRRPEDGPRRVRQQQRRHVRQGVPLADGLRAQADVRRVGWHAGLPVGGPGRRHHGDRRQPHRRASGLRVAG